MKYYLEEGTDNYRQQNIDIMKIFTSILLCIMTSINVFAQNTDQDDQNLSGKFYLGITYSYFGNELKLLSMTQQSIWQDVDLGIYELDKDEIDTLNSFVDYNISFHAPGLEAGIVLLNKPDSRWYIDTKIMVGLSKIVSQTYNTNENTTDMDISSEKFTPWFGLGFNIKSRLGNKWGLKLAPIIAYSWTNTDEIEDNLIPITEFFEETRVNKANYLYSRLSIFATYTWKEITFNAGPGFYMMYNKHNYKIERTDPDEGDVYIDIIDTKMISESFIDVNIGLDWEINHRFTLNALCGFGKDFMLHTGIKYYL